MKISERNQLEQQLRESEARCRALEVQVRESEHRFRIMFEQPAISLSFVSLDGRWLYVNQKLCEIVGYTREELLATTYQAITYCDDIDTNLAYIRRLLAGEIQTFSLEKRYIHKDGSLIWVNVTVSLARDTTGEPQYLFAAIEDISERKRVEAERAQLLLEAQETQATAEAVAEKLTILQIITDTALAHLSLENLLSELLHRISDALNAEAAAILLPTQDGRHLKVRASQGLGQEEIDAIEVPLGPSVVDHITLRQGPIIVEDLTRVKLLSTLLREKISSLVAAPLLIEGQVIGFISVGTVHTRTFTQEDVQLLQRAADRVALAIDRVHLYEAEQQARKEATARAQQLEATFEAMIDAVVVYDSKGQITFASTSAQELFPLTAQPDYYSRMEEDRISHYGLRDERSQPLPHAQWPMRRVLNGEVLNGDKAVDIIFSAVDGHEKQFSITGSPIRDANDHIVGAVLIARDVTTRRRLERRTQEALEGLLGMAESLVQLPESDQGMEMMGRRLAELTRSVLDCQRVGIYGGEPETELLRPLAVVGLSPEQERSWWEEQQESSLSDNPHPELIAALRAGEVLVLDMTMPPFVHQPNPYNIKIMLVVPMSIGDRLIGLLSLDYGSIKHKYTQGEIVLASAVGKLSALVIERQRLLRERAESQGREVALREANGRMEEFLGVASHELRTPLTTIKANIQLAKRRLKSVGQMAEGIPEAVVGRIDAAHDMLLRAERQVGVLNRLVGDLIDISRIQTGKLQLHMRPAPSDLAEIVSETVQEQRKAVAGRTINLEMLTDDVVSVDVDPDRITQVLTNYLGNALKYSLPDKPVVVSLEVNGPEARVSVHDEGIGLSVENQQRIWQCFYQAEDVKVLSGSGVGLGLGLYISQIIIERHHGQVGVQSVQGAGSTFWFTLPLVQPAESTTGEENDEAS